jgi:3-deoxy-manno-octulosonate cytidylyltransferase (CMP-KDO synthetase)
LPRWRACGAGLIPPALIDQVASLLESNPSSQVATLATPIQSTVDLMDPNAVKVVADGQGRALYFSRAPIPWDHDGADAGVASQRSFSGVRRHVGIYGYRVGTLLKLAALEPSRLEQLEQLRALENGFEIHVSDCVAPPGPDVNTAVDLERVTALLQVE